MHGAGRLFIDATGALLASGSAPTGIPRVEDFLIKAALADPDHRVSVVKFDRFHRRFRALTENEARHLSVIHPGITWDGPRLAMLRQAFEMVRRHPDAGREADRHLADMVIKGKRRGVGFEATKTLIRIYRFWRRLPANLRRLLSGGSLEINENSGDTILLCNTTVQGSTLSDVVEGQAHTAFICHDLIPSLRPDFAVNSDHARRFEASLNLLIDAGSTILCASDATTASLFEYSDREGTRTVSTHRFPMPSTLHQTAAVMTAQRPLGPPFVLYCSTVEVRKNHLMLARIWQQALDEGITLPRLVCVGKWGWGSEPLDAYLKAHPDLASSIVFTGPVSDEQLAAYYRSASFGVFPSYMEGWGYGASECLDFGIPVIVSTAPSLIEATGGLMPAIDPEDQPAWYAAIRRMAEDAEWRSILIERIRTQHRPTPVSASWAAIKNGLLSVKLPEAEPGVTAESRSTASI